MKCEYCKGSGYPFDGERKWVCPVCKGTGAISEKVHLIKELQLLLEESLKETADLKKKLDEAAGAQLMLGLEKEKLMARVDKLCVASEHLTHMVDVAKSNGFRSITDAITAGRKWIEHNALVKRNFDCFGEWLDGYIGDRRGEAYPVVREAFYAGLQAQRGKLIKVLEDIEMLSDDPHAVDRAKNALDYLRNAEAVWRYSDSTIQDGMDRFEKKWLGDNLANSVINKPGSD